MRTAELTPEEKLKNALEKMSHHEGQPGNPIPFKILLSGDLNSGKSSVRTKLAKRLGLKEFYVGNVFRAVARKNRLSINEFYEKLDPATELAIDRKWITKRLLKNPYILIEGRVAPWVEIIANKLGIELIDWDKTRKIRLFLAVHSIEGAKRAILRKENKGKTINQLIKENSARTDEERKHYRSLYGIENHLDRSHFDIIIETTDLTREELLEETHYRIAEWTKRNFLI